MLELMEMLLIPIYLVKKPSLSQLDNKINHIESQYHSFGGVFIKKEKKKKQEKQMIMLSAKTHDKLNPIRGFAMHREQSQNKQLSTPQAQLYILRKGRKGK